MLAKAQRAITAGLLATAATLQLLPAAASAHEALLPGEIQFSSDQLRLSTFADGALLADSRAKIAYQDATPSALSTGSLRAAWGLTRWPGWTAEVFGRQETRIAGSGGTLAAVATFNSDRNAKGTGVALPFSVNAQTMRRVGLGLGHTFSTNLPGTPVVALSGRAFAVDKFRSVEADGIVTEATNGDLGLRAYLLDHKLGGDSDYIHPAKTLGYGFAIDVSSLWGSLDQSYLFVAAQDIGPDVRIKHVLQTRKNINTNTVSYDANGHIQFAPIVNGKYTDTSVSAKQYPRFVINGAQKIDKKLSALLLVNSSHPITDVGIGFRWLASDHSWQATVHGGSQLPTSLALNWRYRAVNLQWRGDSLSPSKARVWGLSATLRF